MSYHKFCNVCACILSMAETRKSLDGQESICDGCIEERKLQEEINKAQDEAIKINNGY